MVLAFLTLKYKSQVGKNIGSAGERYWGGVKNEAPLPPLSKGGKIGILS